MILPLFGGLTQIELLAMIIGFPVTDPYKLVYDTITGGTGPAAEARFRKFLHDGVLENSTPRPIRAHFNPAPLAGYLAVAIPPPEVSAKQIEVRFVADARVDDGRFINNGWLQECPDPITKISWDNAILISPRLARELGIDSPADGLKQVARKELAEFNKGRENAHVVEGPGRDGWGRARASTPTPRASRRRPISRRGQRSPSPGAKCSSPTRSGTGPWRGATSSARATSASTRRTRPSPRRSASKRRALVRSSTRTWRR
jgi:hypothetical protein